MARDVRAGGAFVEIGARSKALDRGLKRASASLRNFGSKVQGIGLGFAKAGLAIAAPLALSVRTFSKFGDQIAKMAKRTGLGTEALSEFAHMADLTGTSLESFEKGIKRMQGTIFDAKLGLSTATDSLDELGLSFEDLEGKQPQEQFKLLGDAIGGIADPTMKAAIASKLFGRAGTQLIPLFDEGAESMRKMAEDAKFLGIVITDDMAKSAEVLTDQLARSKSSMKGLQLTIGQALAPAISELSNKFVAIVVGVRRFIDENRELVLKAAKVAAVLLGIGAGLTAIAIAATVAAAIISGLGTVISLVATVFSPLGIAIMASVAAIVLLGDAILTMTGAANTGITDFVQNIRIGGTAISTWMEVVWLKIFKGWEWIKFGIMAGWESLKFSVLSAGNFILRGLLSVASAISSGFWAAVKGIIDAITWLAQKTITIGNKLHLVSDESFENAKGKIDGLSKGMEDFANKQKELGKSFYTDEAKSAIDAQEKRMLDFQETRQKSAEATAKKIAALEIAINQAFKGDAAKGDSIGDLKKKLDSLKSGFADAVSEARNLMGGGAVDPTAALGGTQQAITSAQTIRGSFSAASAAGAAQGPIVKAQEKSNKLLKKIADNTAEGQVARFGI